MESEIILNKDVKVSVDTSPKKDQRIGGERSFKNYIELKLDNTEGKETSSIEASDFYLM